MSDTDPSPPPEEAAADCEQSMEPPRIEPPPDDSTGSSAEESVLDRVPQPTVIDDAAGRRQDAHVEDNPRSDESARDADAENRQRARERVQWGSQNSVDQMVGRVNAVGAQRQVADNIYNFGPRDVDPVRSNAFRPDWVASIVDTYVPVSEFDHIVEILDRHGVVYLMGCEGTGRAATALAALSTRCGTEQMRLVTLSPDARLPTLLDHGEELLPGHGHVLEMTASEPTRVQTLAAIAGLLGPREERTYLVIVGWPARKVEASLAPYAVGHSAPDATVVLERHLCTLMCSGNCEGDRCQNVGVRACFDNEEIAAYLGKSPLPGELADLARRIVEVREDGLPPNAALPLLNSHLRDLAARLLNEDKLPEASRAQLRTISLRVAYAVFYNSPLTVVFDAAAGLFAELSVMTGPDTEPQPAALFDGGVETLLLDDMRGRVTPGLTDGGLPDHERIATVVDPALGRAVLEVLWNEYDQVRQPLLRWLCRMGGDPRQRVRLRAASAAGLLATFDFSEVYWQVIRSWAADIASRRRDTAAWAMEFIADERSMTARVRRQVQDWCLSTDLYLNDTAARTYGTNLGRLFAEEALASLHFLARKPSQTRYDAIARAVTEICWPDNGPVVLAALRDWVQGNERSPNAQAARSVLFLAHRMAPEPDDAWPALLVLARDPVAAASLQLLWRQALCEAITAWRAWEVLAGWLVRSSRRGELEDETVNFAGQLLSSRALRSRALRFYLPAWRNEYGNLPIWERLRGVIRERTAS